MITKISTNRRKLTIGFAATLALGLMLPMGSAYSQAVSSKPITITVPFAPGGSNDIVGRAIAEQLSTRFNHNVIVENRPGAGGLIGSERVSRATPDGTNLLIISAAFSMMPAVTKLSYDPVKSFTPIAMLGMGPSVIAVTSTFPANTIQELVEYSKKNPGKVYFGSAGVASFQHFAIELFRMKTGADLTIAHYKGGGPALMDVAAGNVQVTLGSLIQMKAFLESGKIKLLAVAGPKRVDFIPKVPTLMESGIDVDVSNWWALLAPAGTPDGIVNQLHDEINTVLEDPKMKARFAAEGADTLAMTRPEFDKFFAAQIAKWADVAKQTGIKRE